MNLGCELLSSRSAGGLFEPFTAERFMERGEYFLLCAHLLWDSSMPKQMERCWSNIDVFKLLTYSLVSKTLKKNNNTGNMVWNDVLDTRQTSTQRSVSVNKKLAAPSQQETLRSAASRRQLVNILLSSGWNRREPHHTSPQRRQEVHIMFLCRHQEPDVDQNISHSHVKIYTVEHLLGREPLLPSFREKAELFVWDWAVK